MMDRLTSGWWCGSGRHRGRLCRLIGLAILLFGFATSAHGESGQLESLPRGRGRPKHKLRMNVDTRWADGTGYRPIVVELVPFPAPALEDRQVRVVFQPNSMSELRVSKVIEIPEGSTSVRETISIPQDELWYNLRVDVFEGGEKLEELSDYGLTLARSFHFNWTEATPAVLFIDKDVPAQSVRDRIIVTYRASGNVDKNPTYTLPDYRNLMRTFPEAQYSGVAVASSPTRESDLALLSQLTDAPRASLLPPAELPAKWLDYTSFDMAFISLADLQLLASQEPERFRAINHWLRSGPVLCVYDVGNQYEQLAELEKLLALPELPHPTSGKRVRYRGWREPDAKRRDDELPVASRNQYAYAQPMTMAIVPAQGDLRRLRSKTPPTEPWPFIVRPAGMGCVVAIRDNPFPGDRQQWVWLLNSIPEDRWMWYRRHGMSLHRTNDDFWDFLIPGVGVAPVISFLALITLFAVFIGPVNYIFLNRWQRLYLLLITVPLGATVVTGSLFLYAVVTDGLGVRTRIRSYTELDAASGQAVSWSRQSYYASIAPSQGLTFPEHTAVYTLEHQPTSQMGRRTYSRRLDWDEGQTLRAGYLSSRTATQFLVINAADTKARLVVKRPNDDKLPVLVQNHLGADIQYLLVADRASASAQKGKWETISTADGEGPKAEIWVPEQRFWEIRDLKQGEQGTLKPVDLTKARQTLNRVYRDNPLEFPVGYNPTLQNSTIEMLLPTTRWYQVDGGAPDPNTATSLLERHLARLAHRGSALLEPGAFLAITSRPEEVPIGVPRVTEQQGLHVIHGRW